MLTFIRMTLFSSTPAGFCKSHMKRIRRVFPQPVSPIMITGMPHLQAINNLSMCLATTTTLHCSAILRLVNVNKIKIYSLAHRNLLWDILRLPSSRRAALGLCHSHAMTNMGRELATIRIAAYIGARHGMLVQ